MRGDVRYVPYQKGVIQGYPGRRYPTSSWLVFQDQASGSSLRCKLPIAHWGTIPLSAIDFAFISFTQVDIRSLSSHEAAILLSSRCISREITEAIYPFPPATKTTTELNDWEWNFGGVNLYSPENGIFTWLLKIDMKYEYVFDETYGWETAYFPRLSESMDK